MACQNLSAFFPSTPFVSGCVKLLLVLCFAAGQAFGQQEKPENVIRLRNLSWSRVNTPDYSVTASERSTRMKQWTRIEVRYETAPEWIDDLEFRFFVVVNNPKKPAEERHLMFTRNVQYIDIARGRDKMSTIFLRPNTVDRHGDVERVAVEVYYRGERAGFLSSTRDDQREWWTLPGAKAMARTGYLWTRTETPFAFVAYDLFEQLRQ